MHAYRKTRLIRRPLAATLPLALLASAALPAIAGNSCLTTNINDVTDIFSDSVLNGSITENGGTFACGRDNIADGEGATAMGYNNWAGGVLSSAFGFNNKIAGQAQGAAVFGTNNTSFGVNSAAFGFGNMVQSGSGSAFGTNNFSKSAYAVAFGTTGSALGTGSMVMSGWYDRDGDGAITNDIDRFNDGNMTGSSEAGVAFGTSAVAVGAGVAVVGDYSSAVGVGNTVFSQYGSAFGFGGAVFNIGATAIGYQAVGDRDYAVSVGKTGGEHQIIHLAAGTEDTDAVNLGQLNAAIGGISSYSGFSISADDGATGQAIASGDSVLFESDDANGNLSVSRDGNTIRYGFSSAPTFAGLTVGGGGANFTIVNNTVVNMGGNVVAGVADGVAATDAVNVGQLQSGLAGANANAAAAQATADDAVAAAGEAQSTADSALAAAGNAQTTADTALANAATAQASADAAQATADTALTVANNAVGVANDYTDTREAAIRADMTSGDATTLSTANSYTDTRSAQTLSSANAYTDGRVAAMQQNFDSFRNDVWTRMDQTDRRIDRNGAMQSAMAQMTASAAGVRTVNRMAVGVGSQNGRAAVAIGYQRAVGDRAAFTIGGAFSGDDSSAGVGYGWGW